MPEHVTFHSQTSWMIVWTGAGSSLPSTLEKATSFYASFKHFQQCSLFLAWLYNSAKSFQHKSSSPQITLITQGSLGMCPPLTNLYAFHVDLFQFPRAIFYPDDKVTFFTKSAKKEKKTHTKSCPTVSWEIKQAQTTSKLISC